MATIALSCLKAYLAQYTENNHHAMVRMTDVCERRRELVENSMACHAGMRKSVEIIQICLRQGTPASIDVARKEMEYIKKKINQSQTELSTLWNEDLWK